MWKKHETELIALTGKNKKLPEGYELQAALALAYYPELKDIKIEFVIKKQDYPLSSKPINFDDHKKRRYRIVISDKLPEERELVLFSRLPFELQVSSLGHELGHVSDYIRKSNLEIVKIGLGFFLPEYRTKLEKKTDGIAIAHGFGYQQLKYVKRIAKLQGQTDDKYISEYFKYYMTPSDIEGKIKRLKIYKRK